MTLQNSSKSSVPNTRATYRQPSSIAKQRIVPLSYWRLFAAGNDDLEGSFNSVVEKRLGAGTRIFPIGRARGGIYLLSKLAIRGNRTEVVLSPYTIPDVVNMVLLAGAKPVFYDFLPNSTSCDVDGLSALITDQTAAVIITHYHVNEPSTLEIAELCRSRGAYLFDDCAIAFGGSLKGAPIGTHTDASVASFSSFKLINYFWGGLITTRDPDLAERISSAIAEWPRLNPRDYVAPAKAILKYDLASQPLAFRSLVFPLLRKRAMAEGSVPSLEYVRLETDQMTATLTSRPAAAAYAEWLPKLADIDKTLSRRRLIAGIYGERLGPNMVSANAPGLELEGSCFVNFPILLPEGRRDDIAKMMMVAGFDVGRSLYANSHDHPKFSGIEGCSENVRDLVARVIYLPTHFAVSEEYARQVSQHLRELM